MVKKTEAQKLESTAIKGIRRCDVIRDFDERLSCKSKLLNEVTKVQDTVNLNIMGDFGKSDPNCSRDKRWQPVHLVDNANAIILGISSAEFNPERFWYVGSYVEEKADSLERRFWSLPKRK